MEIVMGMKQLIMQQNKLYLSYESYVLKFLLQTLYQDSAICHVPMGGKIG